MVGVVGMVDRLLLLHAGALGDLALTLRVALQVLEAQGASGLDVVSRSDCGELGEFSPRVRRRSVDGLGVHALFSTGDDPLPPAVCEMLRARRVINALSDCASPVHARISQHAEAVFSFDPRPRVGLNDHITAQWQRDLAAQGLVFLQGYELPALRRSGPAGPGAASPVVIHPGSGGAAKCWPLAEFLRVARRLRNAGRTVTYVIGPAECERWPAAALEAISGEFSLQTIAETTELVRLLSRAAVLIGNDAGPAHLAALLGTPTVTIFGPTSASIWRPLGGEHIAIQGDPTRDPHRWGVSAAKVAAAAIGRISERQ